MDTGSVELTVVVRRASEVCTVEVAGDVDESGAATLRKALDRAVAALPDRIEVDLSSVTFFCCAGVSALLAARKAAGGRLILLGAATPVRTVLTALNLASALEYPDPKS